MRTAECITSCFLEPANAVDASLAEAGIDLLMPLRLRRDVLEDREVGPLCAGRSWRPLTEEGDQIHR
ncbi:hypothetical protein ACFVFF_36960 [Streptomyces sp. NPDC057680]|uniref:hypothetical protein n=1 Tax=Streptomyces sp. NPDC057680 TaxID=3346208 RepID=UPI00369FE307